MLKILEGNAMINFFSRMYNKLFRKKPAIVRVIVLNERSGNTLFDVTSDVAGALASLRGNGKTLEHSMAGVRLLLIIEQ